MLGPILRTEGVNSMLFAITYGVLCNKEIFAHVVSRISVAIQGKSVGAQPPFPGPPSQNNTGDSPTTYYVQSQGCVGDECGP